jgi:hypothetical protein
MSKETPPPPNARFATPEDFKCDSGIIHGLQYFEYHLGYRECESRTVDSETDQPDLLTRILMKGVAIEQIT